MAGGLGGGQGVFVIGATSRLEAIDPALRTGRRLGREIAMGIPDEKARRKILEVSKSYEGCVTWTGHEFTQPNTRLGAFCNLR